MIEDLSKLTKAQLIELVQRKDESLRIYQDCSDFRAHSPVKGDQLVWRMNTLQGDASGVLFDEVVVGDWLHIEMLSGGPKRATFWARVGDRAFSFVVTPKSVKVTAMYDQCGSAPVLDVKRIGEP